MSMPITFDSMKEFEAFCKAFEPRSNGAATSVSPTPNKSTVAKIDPKAAARAVKPIQSPRREVKSITPANKLAKHPSKKLAAPKPNTLTAQVKASIQALIDAKRPFSANDVYAKLAEANPKATKPTVLSTASKLMATQYHLLSEERPSAGIRPMRVYLPEGRQAVSV